MTITDLTGTKWLLDSTLFYGDGEEVPQEEMVQLTYAYDATGWVEDGRDVFEISLGGINAGYLNFTSNNENFVGLVSEDYVPLGAANLVEVYRVNWSNQAYRTIEITGGTDATNTSLIAWLTENATQIIDVKKYISAINQGNQKYLVKDTEVRTSINNIIDTSGHIAVEEDDTLVWTVGNSPTPPTEYIIPAGQYYGKANPHLYDEFVITFPDGQFTSNNVSYDYMWITGLRIWYGIGETPPQGRTLVYYDDNGWEDASYRTIEVSEDTTVTQDQYNAFFSCFDYAFTLQLIGGDKAYYPFSPLGMTWQQFVQSSYNNGHFSITLNKYVNYDMAGIYYYIKHDVQRSAYATDVIDTSIEYVYSGGSN